MVEIYFAKTNEGKWMGAEDPETLSDMDALFEWPILTIKAEINLPEKFHEDDDYIVVAERIIELETKERIKDDPME